MSPHKVYFLLPEEGPKNIERYCSTNLLCASGKRVETRHVREKMQLAVGLCSECTALVSSNLAILTKIFIMAAISDW